MLEDVNVGGMGVYFRMSRKYNMSSNGSAGCNLDNSIQKFGLI